MSGREKAVGSGQEAVGGRQSAVGRERLQTAHCKLHTEKSETIPKGWIDANICEISNIVYGKGLPKKSLSVEGQYPVFGANSIIGYHDSYLYEKPQVLISCRGANSGTINISPEKCFVTSNSLVVQLPDKYYTSCRYVFYSLVSANKEGIVTGTAQPQVTIDNLKNFYIPLAPLNEQKRIVAKLDKIIPRIDTVKERLDKVPTIIKRFRQAIVANACSKGDSIRIESIIIDIRYGTSKKCKKTPNEIPVLRIPNIAQGKIDSSDLKHTTLSDDEFQKLSLRDGDILLIRSNGSVSLVGKTALVTKEFINYAFAGYLIRLRLDENKAVPEYVNLALQSYNIRCQIEIPARSTSGVNNINSKEVKNLRINLPSIAEQKEIVRQVDKFFAIANKLEKHYQNAKAKVDKLSQSVLAKTFRGELVPQDPNDEPAEKLLERIQEEKARLESKQTPGRKKPGKRTGQKNAKKTKRHT